MRFSMVTGLEKRGAGDDIICEIYGDLSRGHHVRAMNASRDRDRMNRSGAWGRAVPLPDGVTEPGREVWHFRRRNTGCGGRQRMKLGIIGLGRAGQTTVFNALTRRTGNPCCGRPNGSGSGVVSVPDPRVDWLSRLLQAQENHLRPGYLPGPPGLPGVAENKTGIHV